METELVSPPSLYWSTFNFSTFDFVGAGFDLMSP